MDFDLNEEQQLLQDSIRRTLADRYGEQYAAYRRAVPAWVPRLRPWRGT